VVLTDRLTAHLDAETRQEAVYSQPSPAALLSLQILYPGPLALDPRRLMRELRLYHPQLSRAAVNLDPILAREGIPVGKVRWGRHVIGLVGFNAPIPAQVLETCLGSGDYPAALKAQVRASQAHVVLDYEGFDRSPLERYVALAVVASVLSRRSALLILNERGRTSLPASALATGLVAGDKLELLRSLPVPYLYSGFARVELAGVPGVWMRTYGNHLLGVPDLATLSPGPEQGGEVFEMFSTVIGYLLASGASLGPGHTMQVGTGAFIRLRFPRPDEYFLESEGSLFVAEMITENQINRGRKVMM